MSATSLRGESRRASRSRTRRLTGSCGRWSSPCRPPRSLRADGWRGAASCTGRTSSFSRSPTRSPGWASPWAITGSSPIAASRPPAHCGRCWACWARWRSRAGRRMGRHPSQAPSLLEPSRRPAQPSRRPCAGMARRAARARPRACRLDVPRQGQGQAATRRICSPTVTCASSAAPSRSGWRSDSTLPFGLGVALTGTVAGGLTGLLWGGAVRIFLLHHATFSINSLCHFYGRRPSPPAISLTTSPGSPRSASGRRGTTTT